MARTLHTSAGIILINRRGQVLLELRANDPAIMFPGFWGITGGEARPEESPEETARREVREETGLVLESVSPFRTYRKVKDGTLYETHYFHACIDEPLEAMTVGEGEALRFFSVEELRELPLAYSHSEVLTDFAASPHYRACLEDAGDA